MGTRRVAVAAALTWAIVCCASGDATKAASTKHIMVYYEQGRFGGWPANHGIWSWGNEILVGFSRGYYKDLGPTRHHIDREKPEEHLFARSLDGGETWTIEDPAAKGFLIPEGESLHGTETPGVAVLEWRECPGNIEFTHPDFAMTVRMTNVDHGPSRFYYSYDRGHTWEGPFRLPDCGTKGIAARTDYIVNGKHDCMLFLTAAKENGEEGRPLCIRTRDGGKTWNFVSWIAPEPAGYAIMPSTVQISKQTLLSVVRCRDEARSWLAAYLSENNGRSWQALDDSVADLGEGNPPSLSKLKDGRLCLTYGYRAEPFKMAAKLSSDGGRTWADEIVLRDDGANRDMGYPRSVQRPDGKVVTVYYFNDAATGPERYIAASIWDPNETPRMNVYVCTDLEGVCGVHRWEQTREYDTPANVEARHLLMGEVNAAVAGAFDAGATRVVVRDGHGGAKNFFAEELDERAEMVMGATERVDQELQEGFDVAILLGYHAMSNTPNAVLCHTQSSTGWENYWINGRLAGEIAQSAIVVGSCGIPVAMVTGDDKTCAEAQDWLGEDVVTVQVKKALTQTGACMPAPKKARTLIREGARQAVAKAASLKPYKPEFPLTIRWQFKDIKVVEGYNGDGTIIDKYTIEKLVKNPCDIYTP